MRSLVFLVFLLPAFGTAQEPPSIEDAAFTRLIQGAISSGNTEEALRILDERLDREPGNGNLLETRLYLAMATGDRSMIEASMQRMLRAAPLDTLRRAQQLFEDRNVVASELIEAFLTYRARGQLDQMMSLARLLENVAPDEAAVALLLGQYFGSDTLDHDAERATRYLAQSAAMRRWDVELPRGLVRSIARDDLWIYSGVHDPKFVQQLQAGILDDLRRVEKGEKLDWVVNTDSDVSDLFMDVLILKQQREPEEMLELLDHLEDLEPDNPAVFLAMGEAHASLSGRSHRSSAISAFQRLLEITDEVGYREPDADPVAEDLMALRGRVRGNIEELASGRRLYILSSLSVVQSQLARRARERGRIRASLANMLAQIESQEALLQEHIQAPPRRSRNFDINSMRRRIRESESRAEDILEEMAEINMRIGNLATSLGNLGPEAAGAVPDLISAISYSEFGVSAEVLIALGRIGPAAREAIPTLEVFTSGDSQIRELARETLRQIQR